MTIEVDDAGWGDLVGGCVVVIRRVETDEYYAGEISVEFFKEPKFKTKQYLDKALEIVEDGLKKLNVHKDEEIRMCTGFLLSKARRSLSQQGYLITPAKIVGETQKLAERTFLETLGKIGLKLDEEDPRRRFHFLLEWVREKPESREKYVKTGWRSWKNKWRTRVSEKV